MRRSMRAMVLQQPEELQLRHMDIPRIGPQEILVKVEVALTCGTDLKTYKRGHPLIGLPVILGHEFAGTVAEAGREVEKVSEGMRVVAANTAPCNNCFFCRKGRQNLCVHVMERANWGAFAEYIKIPSHIVKVNTYEIPPKVSSQAAAFLEPLACVILGNEAADIQLADTVALVGTGPIGLLHLQLARQRGATEIIATDLSEGRLQIAKKLGATHTINAGKEDQVALTKQLTDGWGADVVIECVGLPSTWETAVRMTRRGGTTVLFGGPPPGSTVTIDASKLHYDELTVKGVFHHTPRTVETAFRMITSGNVQTEPLVTHVKPLEDLEEALNLVASGSAVKVAITPGKRGEGA